MSLSDKWYSLPTWGKWTVGIFAIVTVDAIFVAWGERRFVAAFAEHFAAIVLYYGVLFGGVAAGYWGGSKTFKKTSKTWLAWTIGILATLAVWFLTVVTEEIPGVGWRIKKIQEFSGSYEY